MASMQEDTDTCRICSMPAEPDSPLYYPCKCSGTIRYIHQDCLTTWLTHSKKKSCDVCKHPYSFTKVYAPNMPDTLPPLLFAQRFAAQVVAGIFVALRATLVAIVWLAVLPYGTVWTWRLYFWLGNQVAWWIYASPRPENLLSVNATSETPAESLSTTSDLSESAEGDSTNSTLSPAVNALVRTLSTDIFHGQIIACVIVLAFLAVFLLREWIIQNARPGVFDDEIIAPLPEVIEEEMIEEPEQLPVEPLQPLEVPQVEVDHQPPLEPVPPPAAEPSPLEALYDQRESYTPPPAPRLAHAQAIPLSALPPETGPSRLQLPQEAYDNEYMSDEETTIAGEEMGGEEVSVGKGKGKAFPSSIDGVEDETDTIPPLSPSTTLHSIASVPSSSTFPVSAEASSVDTQRYHARIPRHPTPPRSLKRRRVTSIDAEPSMEDFDFGPRRSAGFRFGSEPSSLPSASGGSEGSSVPSFASSSPFQQQFDFLPPKGSPRLDFGIGSSKPETPRFSSSRSERPHDYSSSSSTAGSPILRRPPLPASAKTSEGSESLTWTAEPVIPAPMPSPSLAMYRPPEDLKEPSSTVSSNARPVFSEEELRGRKDAYFARVDVLEGPAQPELPANLEADGANRQDQGSDHEDDEAELVVQEFPDQEEDLALFAEEDEADNRAPAPPGAPMEEGGEVEPDAAVEDDMDGVLEAIGMRGPIHAVFQNAALMIVILDMSIAAAIWFPFLLGKTLALLCLDPPRLMQLAHLPIRLVRLLTDPIVDTTILLSKRVLLPALFHIIFSVWDFFAFGFDTMWKAAFAAVIILSYKVFGADKTRRILSTAGRAINKTSALTSRYLPNPRQSWDRVFSLVTTTFRSDGAEKTDIVPAPEMTQASTSAFIAQTATQLLSLVPEGHPAVVFLEDHFSELGKTVRVNWEVFAKLWAELAQSDGTNERIFAIGVGYAAIAVGVAVYMNSTSVAGMKGIGRAIRNAVRQQVIVVKVAVFIAIELFLFPLGCGLLLDIATLPLFGATSISSRMSAATYAPVTSIFYRWIIGTMYMHLFAMVLQTCRDTMRTGAMWFIKDPTDPASHPIRDLLDRPTLWHLRKLMTSVIMYGGVILCGIGTSVALLTLNKTPLRWKMQEPLSEVPVDLLFVHLFVPTSLYYFKPLRIARKLFDAWWKFAARQLRLSSFMFGGRYPDEEYSGKFWRPQPRTASPTDSTEFHHEFDGSFRRAPAVDNVVFLKDRYTLVETDEHGVGIDATAKETIHRQNVETLKAHRDPTKEFIVVYVPPRFRTRIFAFALSFWTTGALAIFSFIMVPIRLGRIAFSFFGKNDIHDGYSFVLGFYIVWALALVRYLVEREVRRWRKRQASKRTLGRFPWFSVTKRFCVWLAKISYMILTIGFIMPTLAAVVVELYIVMPIRVALSPSVTPTIHIFESWAIGLVYGKIYLRTQQLHAENNFTRAVEEIKRNGWMRPDPWNATRDVIAPVIGGLLAMVFFPGLIMWAIMSCVDWAYPSLQYDHASQYRLVYPAVFILTSWIQLAIGLSDALASWKQSVRDREFLVEVRVRNLDSNQPQDPPQAAAPSAA